MLVQSCKKTTIKGSLNVRKFGKIESHKTKIWRIHFYFLILCYSIAKREYFNVAQYDAGKGEEAIMCKNMRPRKNGYCISEFLLKAKDLNNIMTSDIFK